MRRDAPKMTFHEFRCKEHLICITNLFKRLLKRDLGELKAYNLYRDLRYSFESGCLPRGIARLLHER